ncbi:hypothetical protein LI951_04020 [Enterococcus sp. BWT-B8]|uniref:hypothetical protein n=1 Tax=Enterococcus sp. BWT-B8 TaxID=2885157 RepID=UPI001E31CE72|nr:hypothetical protein [Enterococcus sp. BWT-B8]MCB5951226.1 hypothetical protein [Enterococcus sp. BWT-B8]
MEGTSKKNWFPEYLNIENGAVAYKYISEEVFYNWFPVAEKIASLAIQSNIVKIICYGDIDSYFDYKYIVETAADYVLFHYWTTG